jgi:hypothetical protein
MLEQPQSGAHDIAGRPVTARRDLLLGERAVMVIEAR